MVGRAPPGIIRESGELYTKNHDSASLNYIRLLYADFKTDTVLSRYSMKMTSKPVKGYWENEKYTTLNIDSNLRRIIARGVQVYAFYGMEDGLYSPAQGGEVRNIVGDAQSEAVPRLLSQRLYRPAVAVSRRSCADAEISESGTAGHSENRSGRDIQIGAMNKSIHSKPEGISASVMIGDLVS